MPDAMACISENLAQLRQRVAEAAQASGRKPEAVTLIGVTKYVSPEIARLVAEAGCHDLGESRPQELWRKHAALADLSPRWHLVGHLQRNKLRRTLPLVEWIHSVDSRRLLAALNEEAQAAEISPRVLLEVNASGDVEKHGFQPEELPGLLEELVNFPAVKVRGLMTMASREGGPDIARQDFDRLRELRDAHRGDCPDGVTLDELSMGMSGDFEQAIAAGATLVRIGSSLFEGVEV